MIGYITKQFFRSYIMSPRIVLLFLGLVITICKATVDKPTLSYPSNEKLHCAFGTGGGNDCDADISTDGCIVKISRGTSGSEIVVFTGTDNTTLDYIPTRNDAQYTCKAFKDGQGSLASNVQPVADLAATPTVGDAWSDANTCGAKDQDLICTVGTPDTSTTHMRVVKKGETPAITEGWIPKADAPKKSFAPFVKEEGGEYYCDAATSGQGAKMARSDPKTIGCADCTLDTDCTGADHSRTKCDNGSSGTKNCIKPGVTKTPTSVNPAHTTGVSGGGGKDTTGSKGGTTSGASDLGRPASVLTIVCSLLTLTLALRG